VEPFDPTRPNIARVWDYWLGGKDGLEVVPPGVVAVRIWNGDGPALDVQAPTATFIGGVARKP
jgi:hypothetical protein